MNQNYGAPDLGDGSMYEIAREQMDDSRSVEIVKVGRMTNAEILAGVDMTDVVSVVRSAHNEITRTFKNGKVIVRLRETDIVIVFPETGSVLINTGGWNTVTTRRHINDFLSRQNFPARICKARKGGGVNVLVQWGQELIRQGNFQTRCVIGKWSGGYFIIDDADTIERTGHGE